MGEDTVFAQFRENKYEIFDWGFQGVNVTLLENLIRNPESKSVGSILLFKVCVLQLYHAVLIITFLIPTVVMFAKQVKMVPQCCLSF